MPSESAPPCAWIAGTGMVTALGLDAATSCAAARAGLSRASTLAHYRVRSAVEGVEEPVVGHAIPLLTRGFEGPARLLRLLEGALADLRDTIAPEWLDTRIPVYASLPDPTRVQRGDLLVADPATRRNREEDAQAEPIPPLDRTAAEGLVRRATTAAGFSDAGSLAWLSTDGHAGGAAAACAALADFARGRSTCALVLAGDSLLDAGTLDWLHACGRLKVDGTPNGLRPGEAAVALLLTSAAAPGVPRLRGGFIAKEERPLIDGHPARGIGLAQAIAGTREMAKSVGEPWILADHNGEVYRATDLGNALVRLRAHDAAFGTADIWYPAIGFGDTGGASALVGVVTAVRAFARHHAPAATAIVASASDGPLRAGLAVDAGA